MRRVGTAPPAARLRLAAEVVLVGLGGAVLGLLVAGSTTRDVGPFEANLSLRPALSGQSVVQIPPLGELRLDSHDGPVTLDIRLEQLKRADAAAIVADPDRLQSLGADVGRDVRHGVLLLALRAVLVALLGSLLLGLLAFRRARLAVASTASGLALLLGVGGVAATTFHRGALQEPRFSGLLAFAPNAVGDVRQLTETFDAYSQQLGRLVSNVSQLYAATSTLPSFRADDSTTRVLHVSDLHLNPAAIDIIRSVVKQYGVDVVVDSGDLTDHGTEAEDKYVAGIATVGAPYVFVRGNHDSTATEAAVRRLPNATVLSGVTVEVAGLRMLGDGDPRFTPDKTTRDDSAPREVLTALGSRLADAADARGLPDLVVVHDPISAEPLMGRVPLVLAGHAHRRKVSSQDGTRLMVEGSTGGAGLRALEGDEPTPVEMTVLYLDPVTHRLQAYDEITLGGLGATEARIVRHVVPVVPRAR